MNQATKITMIFSFNNEENIIIIIKDNETINNIIDVLKIHTINENVVKYLNHLNNFENCVHCHLYSDTKCYKCNKIVCNKCYEINSHV